MKKAIISLSAVAGAIILTVVLIALTSKPSIPSAEKLNAMELEEVIIHAADYASLRQPMYKIEKTSDGFDEITIYYDMLSGKTNSDTEMFFLLSSFKVLKYLQWRDNVFSINIGAYSQFANAYGETKTMLAFNLLIFEDTLAKINFDTAAFDRLPEIADAYVNNYR